MTTEQLKRDLLVKAVHAFDDKYPMTAVQRMDLGLLIGDAVDKIIEQLSAQTAEPAYAHEYGRSKGDGTFSVEIVRGEVKPHHSPCKDWPIKPLYTHPAKTEQPETMTAQELANRIRNGERWKLAETEQPSLSDERDERKLFEWWAINNQPWLLERSTDDAHKLLILAAWEAWQAAIAAQRQDSDTPAISEQCVSSSGDPIGCYRVRCHLGKVCAAIANGAPK